MSVPREPESANPTIEQVLAEFLDGQRGRLAARTFAKYQHVIELLQHCLDGYGHQTLDKSERALFERLAKPMGGAPREFCQIFGPDKIVPNLGEFLGYFMVRKVIAGNDVTAAAGAATKKLVAWLHERGYVKDDAQEGDESHAALAKARDLPLANKLCDGLVAWLEETGGPEPEDEVEDHFDIVRVEGGKLWLRGMLDARGEGVIGPISVPAGLAKLAKAGWSISGAVGKVRRNWRLTQVWNVYP